MKRLLAVILSALMLVGTSTSVFADVKEDWTEIYEKVLKAYVTGARGNATDYEGFALYDVDKDGTPELFLQEITNKEDYQMYRYNNKGDVTLEQSFKAEGFYLRNENDELIIGLSDGNEGVKYVVYEKGVKVDESDYILLQSERYREKSNSPWEWRYFYLDKAISEEDFDFQLMQLLSPHDVVFHPINEENISQYVYEGKSFYAKQSNPEISMKQTDNNATITFPDKTELEWLVAGESQIYGLLMVNGTFISDVYTKFDQGSTLVPLRAVGQNLDAHVGWDGINGVVTVSNRNVDIIMPIDSNTATVNGKEQEMPIPAQIIDDTTYVPIRFVSENLDTDVVYQVGSFDLPPIVAIEEKYYYGMNSIEEDDAYQRIEALFNNGEWLEGQSVFTTTYIKSIMALRKEGLYLGRFWSMAVDKDVTVRIWVDRYTGQVYTLNDADNGFTIQPGAHHAIDIMLNKYL